MNKTRIAVAGAGYIGRAHISVLQRSPTCELSAIIDPSPATQALAEPLGVPLYASLERLLNAGLPDGIVLATPNSLHVAQAQLCMNAGVPILLEKPLAPTVAQGAALAEQAQRLDARILVGHHRAHSPIMARACEVIAKGSLGRVVSVMGSALFMKPDHYFSDAPWRREEGAGPILLNMIHEVHNLRMLCGEITAVQAFASHAVRRFPVEDTVAINLRFANGALGTFLLSDTAASARSWEQTSGENKAYSSYDDEDCYLIAGTHGSLSVPTMRLKAYPREEDRSWWKPFETSVVDTPREDPLMRQMEHFGAVARGECSPLVSVRDGLANLRVTEAIMQAAKSGQLVEIEP